MQTRCARWPADQPTWRAGQTRYARAPPINQRGGPDERDTQGAAEGRTNVVSRTASKYSNGCRARAVIDRHMDSWSASRITTDYVRHHRRITQRAMRQRNGTLRTPLTTTTTPVDPKPPSFPKLLAHPRHKSAPADLASTSCEPLWVRSKSAADADIEEVRRTYGPHILKYLETPFVCFT